MARVLRVTAASIFFGSRLKLSGSISTNFGVAPSYKKQLVAVTYAGHLDRQMQGGGVAGSSLPVAGTDESSHFFLKLFYLFAQAQLAAFNYSYHRLNFVAGQIRRPE